MSEVALFRAIILRALQDAGGNTGMSRDGHHDRLVVEAQNWFGEMGSDFEKACGLAGFEPEFVAERAKWRMQDGYRRLYDPSKRAVNAA